MTIIWSALLLGLAGSAHCALMCGPLVLVTAPRGSRAVIHHISRILTYGLLGAAAGLAGAAAARLGAGRVVAVLSAAVLLAHAWLRWRARTPSIAATRLTATLSSGLRFMNKTAKRHPTIASIGVGAINGLLPCGLVYAALAASLGLGAPMESAGFMMIFGAGTTPLLALAAGATASVRTRVPSLGRMAPAALVIAAILIAVRAWSSPAGLDHLH